MSVKRSTRVKMKSQMQNMQNTLSIMESKLQEIDEKLAGRNEFFTQSMPMVIVGIEELKKILAKIEETL